MAHPEAIARWTQHFEANPEKALAAREHFRATEPWGDPAKQLG